MKASEFGDDHATAPHVSKIRTQGGRIEGNQKIDFVCGCEDVFGREVDLIGRDTRQCSGRGANFGREVRERGKVIARKGSRFRELGTRELHSVTRVASESDGYAFDVFGVFRRDRLLGVRRRRVGWHSQNGSPFFLFSLPRVG